MPGTMLSYCLREPSAHGGAWLAGGALACGALTNCGRQRHERVDHVLYARQLLDDAVDILTAVTRVVRHFGARVVHQRLQHSVDILHAELLAADKA